MVKEGLRWRICDGSRIRVWKESNSFIGTITNKIYMGTYTLLIKFKRKMTINDVTELFLF